MIQWFKNLDSLWKGILFMNIIWILMSISAFLIFDYTADAFENDLQYRDIGLELLETIKSNFFSVWIMGSFLVCFGNFCIVIIWVKDKIKKPCD